MQTKSQRIYPCKALVQKKGKEKREKPQHQNIVPLTSNQYDLIKSNLKSTQVSQKTPFSHNQLQILPIFLKSCLPAAQHVSDPTSLDNYVPSERLQR